MGRNVPVPVWGAQLIIAAHQSGSSKRRIAKNVKVGESTVKTILRHYRTHQEARVPRQGKGKKDDPRWVFAGPRGAGNLEILRIADEEAEADEMYTELRSRLMQESLIDEHSYRSMCRQMREKLSHTTKRLTGSARERDPLRCLQWKNEVSLRFQKEHYMAIDESAVDNQVRNRRVGHARVGTRARTSRMFFHRGKRYSVLAPFTCDEGFLSEGAIVEGGFDTCMFFDAFDREILPHLRRFPLPHSVLLIDGCAIHDVGGLYDRCASVGALLVFLEPYDPQNMPIELGFRAMKQWIRHNRNVLEHMNMSTEQMLRAALRAVSKKAGHAAFLECGY